jgi:hypothetical protein
MKTCKGCDQSLELEQFTRNCNAKDGRLDLCKKCKKPTPEKLREYFQKCKTRHFGTYLVSNARQSARRHGLACDITSKDIHIPDRCPVLNIPLYRTVGKRTDNTPSLDRINNDGGYTKGNVAVISWRANQLKRDATAQELLAVAAYIQRSSNA